MMKISLCLTVSIAKLCLSISAGFENSYSNLGSHVYMNPSALGPSVKLGVFPQLLSHEKRNLGTFKQYYYYSDEYYAGPGSPVIVTTPGEGNVTGFLNLERTRSVASIFTEFAREVGGALIIFEHRYYGRSTPFANLSTENLQYLTVENVIGDFTHFAQTAKLPFDPHGASRPDKAPWILFGCSYAGSLAAWTAYASPGTYWAYYASSAPVQAVPDNWYYFAAVQKYAPQNCSADLVRIIEHVDQVGTTGTLEEQKSLKAMFGLQSLTYYDDFAAALQWPLNLWQNSLFGVPDNFQYLCDRVEGVTKTNKTLPPACGIGLARALPNFAEYVKPLLPYTCPPITHNRKSDISCLDTHNASNVIFTDTSQYLYGVNRQLQWIYCNFPWEIWRTGAPPNYPSIVSRFVTPQYFSRQCKLYFPSENGVTVGIDRGVTATSLNKYTGGWSKTNSTRVNWVNGQYDGWAQTGVTSLFRPGGPLQSTPEQPVRLIPLAHHCQDLSIPGCLANEGCKAVFNASIAQLKAWIAEFKPTT